MNFFSSRSLNPCARTIALAALMCTASGCDDLGVSTEPLPDTCKIETLMIAEVIYPVNFDASNPPREIQSLRCIVKSKNRVSILVRIAEDSTIAGKIYALIGLEAVDRAEFRNLLATLEASAGTVVLLSGDVAVPVPIKEVLSSVSRGAYAQTIFGKKQDTAVELLKH